MKEIQEAINRRIQVVFQILLPLYILTETGGIHIVRSEPWPLWTVKKVVVPFAILIGQALIKYGKHKVETGIWSHWFVKMIINLYLYFIALYVANHGLSKLWKLMLS